MKNDITIIFLTLNEMPAFWTEFHKKTLLEAAGDSPIITISKIPTNIGTNIIQSEPRSLSNIYWQLLRGAKLAKTQFIGVAEDDTIYPREHFLHIPKSGTFAYNMNHWSLFLWGEPTYSWRNRRGNYSLIAEREIVIEALEERFKKYPNGTPERITGEMGRGMVERNMGITVREASEFMTTIAIVNFNHEFASDVLQKSHRKRMGMVRAFDIPYWGKAKDLVHNFR